MVYWKNLDLTFFPKREVICSVLLIKYVLLFLLKKYVGKSNNNSNSLDFWIKMIGFSLDFLMKLAINSLDFWIKYVLLLWKSIDYAL